MKAYVLIEIRTGEIRDVLRQLKRIQEISEVTMTFGPYDAIAIINAKDVDELGAVIANEIDPIPGVENTMTCLTVDL